MLRMSQWADQHGYSRATVYREFNAGRFESTYGLRALKTGPRSYWVDTDEFPASALAAKLRADGYVVLTEAEFEARIQRAVRHALSLVGGDPSGNPPGNPG